MGAYFGSPEYFVEDGSLSLTLAGLYLIDVEATFTSTSSATGTLDIADSNPCGQGLNTSWIAVPLELYEPPPLSPEVLARIPDFAIPDNLFRKEYGDLEFDDFTKVLGSKGNWFLIQSTPESVLPIPSGWATTETGQDAYYIIFDIHDSEVPLIRIRLGSEGFEGDSRSSTEVISEFEGLVAEISTMKILMKEVLDNDKAYVLLSVETESGRNRYLLEFFSKNPRQGWFHIFSAFTFQEDWDEYYPLIQVIIKHWYGLYDNQLGVELPETLIF